MRLTIAVRIAVQLLLSLPGNVVNQSYNTETRVYTTLLTTVTLDEGTYDATQGKFKWTDGTYHLVPEKVTGAYNPEDGLTYWEESGDVPTGYYSGYDPQVGKWLWNNGIYYDNPYTIISGGQLGPQSL